MSDQEDKQEILANLAAQKHGIVVFDTEDEFKAYLRANNFAALALKTEDGVAVDVFTSREAVGRGEEPIGFAFICNEADGGDFQCGIARDPETFAAFMSDLNDIFSEGEPETNSTIH